MKSKEILKKEGFLHIYDWCDEPNTEYPKHSHKDRVTIFITNGDVTFYFSDLSSHTVSVGQRFDVPVGVEHSAKVGINGCEYIVGEMIEGDS